MKTIHPMRFQFSLRTILFATLIVAGFIAAVSQYGGGGFFLFLLGLGIVLVASATWNRDPNRGTLGVVLVLVALPYFGSASRSIDQTTRPIHVIVTDADSGAPITGARVSLVRASQSAARSFVPTDRSGVAIVPASFRVSRYEYGLTRSGRIWLWEHALSVETPGYEPLQCPLYLLTGKTHDLFGEPLPAVPIELARIR